MEVRRAASIKPVSPDERRDDLYESTRQFLHCPNRAPRSVETATSTECMTAKLTTQDALSAHLREGPDFIVSLAQEAIRRAVQPTKACVER